VKPPEAARAPRAYNDLVRRIIVLICVVGCGAAAAFWYVRHRARVPDAAEAAPAAEDQWLDQLYSPNPADSSAAAKIVERLGARALPMIHTTLQDPAATPERVKSALKACAILGPAAAPAIVEVAEQLADPALTAEAAVALSFMGPGAFGPLRESLGSDNAVVRREALRSLGKLKDRAPLASHDVQPLLMARMSDPDPGVRAVAATYIGIIHDEPQDAVPVLAEGLKDPDPDVRRACASALGSFGADAQPALAALRKAATDADEDVAREAGVAIVKLQPQGK
jgi:HEAT repeat protein